MCGLQALLVAIALFVFNSNDSALCLGDVTFLYPWFVKDPSTGVYVAYNRLDTINVSWVFRDATPMGTTLFLQQLTGTKIFNWSIASDTYQLVPLDQQPVDLGPYYFTLIDESEPGFVYNSTDVWGVRNAKQAPVLWGAYNGTGDLKAYTFSTTTGSSSASLSQTSAALTSSQLTTTSSSSQLNTTASSSQPKITAPPLQASKPLSPRTEIGLIVGCVVGAMSLIAWIWLFITLRKVRASKSKPDPDPVVAADEEPPAMVQRPEGEIYGIDGRERQVELDSVPKQELDAQERARELDSTARYELGVLNGAPPLPPELES